MQERRNKSKARRGDDVEQEHAAPERSEVSEAAGQTIADIDDVLEDQLDEELLADIDDVLESNAAEFVEQYIQQGGQ